MHKKTFLHFLTVLMLTSMLLSACGAPATPTAAPVSNEHAATKVAAPIEQATSEATAGTNEQASSGETAATQGCPAATVDDPMGLSSQWPEQFELSEYEQQTGCTLAYTDNPLFADKVASGELPPVQDRLPEEPLVVEPYHEIGQYGGRMESVSIAPESGTAETLSWRHVNLVRFDDDLQTIVPNVAKSWEWNDDYTELTFNLRKGHNWSDGEPFTVDDILFWYEDIRLNKDLFPEVPGDMMYGDEPYTIEKIDDTTFKYVFAVPAPGFLVGLARTYVQPWQPKHFLSQFHIKYNPQADELAKQEGYDDWVGLFRSYYHDWKDSYHRFGVPTLELHVLSDETTEFRIVSANPYYFKVDTAGQQLPYVNEQRETFIADKEVYNLKIIAGEVDLKGDALDLISYPLYKENEADGNYKVELPPAGLGAGMIYVLNITDKDPVLRQIFSDVRFKQALSLAMDRNEINEFVYLGLAEPMQGLPADPISNPYVTPEQASYMTQYDSDQANALLDEMGLQKGADGVRLRSDGKPLTILMEYCQQAGPILVNELVKQYWEAVGVKVELKEVSTEAFRARTLSNDQEVFLWKNDGTAGPALISDPQRLYPPFGTGLAEFTGDPWYRWWNSNGTEGEEPPADMQKMRDLAMEFATKVPYSDEWNQLGHEIVQLHLDNMIGIGTVGNVPAPVVINNRLGNVPEWTIQIWDYYFHYPFRVDQFFIKQ